MHFSSVGLLVRWMLTPVGALGGWLATALAVRGGGLLVQAAMSPRTLETLLSLDGRLAIVYGLEGFAFVIGGAVIAPRYRGAAATGLFACGALLAEWWLREWYFPESHPRAYQPSHLPLTGCLVGGLLGVLVVFTCGANLGALRPQRSAETPPTSPA